MIDTNIAGVREFLSLLEGKMGLSKCDRQQIQDIVDSAIERQVKAIGEKLRGCSNGSEAHQHYIGQIDDLIDSACRVDDLLWPAKSKWRPEEDDRDEPNYY